MQKDKIIILKTLVGLRAHNLHDKNSDYDYRSVYVLPTQKILSIGYKYKGNDWIEGKIDDTSYEIGHFLQLATQSNPTILEVFKAPIVEATQEGKELRRLFSYIWTPEKAFDAFVGYGLNQRKKFLNKKDNRQDKFAVAYIRTLYNLAELLQTGNFSVKISNKEFRAKLMEYKNGKYKVGDVIQHAEELTDVIKNTILPECKHEQNLEKVNQFLIDIRRKYW